MTTANPIRTALRLNLDVHDKGKGKEVMFTLEQATKGLEREYRYTSTLSLTSALDCDRGRDSAVGIATRYGLDGPGIESQWGRDFPHPSRPALGPTQPPVQWVPGLSRG